MHLDVCFVYISRFIETSESMGTIKGVKRFIERFFNQKKKKILYAILLDESIFEKIFEAKITKEAWVTLQ